MSARTILDRARYLVSKGMPPARAIVTACEERTGSPGDRAHATKLFASIVARETTPTTFEGPKRGRRA